VGVLCLLFEANFGGEMPRRQPNYGPGPGPASGGPYHMHGSGYQSMQYGHGGYSGPATDFFDAGPNSYPTPVSSVILH